MNKKIINISHYLTILWIITPLLLCILNLCGIKHDTMNNLWYYSLAIIGLFGLVISIIYLIKNKNDYSKKYIIFILIGFLFWTLICCFLAENKQTSFFGTPYRHEGFLTYIYYAGIIGLGFINTKNFKINKIFHILIIVAIELSIIMIMNNDFTNKIFSSFTSYTGIFYNENHFGYYLNVVLLLCVGLFINTDKRIQKIFYLLSFSFLLFTLIINNTFGCYLACFITIILIIIYSLFIKIKIKRSLIILLTFVLISMFSISYTPNVINNLSLFNGDIKILYNSKILNKKDKDIKEKINGIGTSRWYLWKLALIKIEEKPLTGVGLENLRYYYYINSASWTDRPHNIVLQTFVFTGLPGGILYFTSLILIFLNHIKLCIKKRYVSISVIIFIGYLISALFGNSMFYTSPYFLLVVGNMLLIKK